MLQNINGDLSLAQDLKHAIIMLQIKIIIKNIIDLYPVAFTLVVINFKSYSLRSYEAYEMIHLDLVMKVKQRIK